LLWHISGCEISRKLLPFGAYLGAVFMPKIEIYSSAMCPYCVRAKMLLQNKGMSWEEIRIDLDFDRMGEMLERSQRRTVPQIFINDFHVGGFDDLAAMDARGELDPLLGINAGEAPNHGEMHSEDGPT
jgi:glutaredoxin 3